MTNQYITVLTIAGSDSVSGAGIQADIKSCLSAGVYATTAITAVTAQNTTGVKSFEPVSPALLKAQIEAVCDDVLPDAVKTGMIPDVASIKIVAEEIKKHSLRNVVIDPVMVATSGDGLCDEDTGNALKQYLFPLAEVVTPNISEAERLSGMSIKSNDDMIAVARKIIAETGCKSVLMKGGHSTADSDGNLTDIFVEKDSITEFKHPYVESANTHGTGCSISSAIAARLATGMTPSEACKEAVEWLFAAIASGKDLRLGHGHGPVNHLNNATTTFATK